MRDCGRPERTVNWLQHHAWQSIVEIFKPTKRLANEHPTLTPDDIGIILLDPGNVIYTLADQLAISIPRELGWRVNKAHETKRRQRGELFISNRNNVKGLEFPFVICVSDNCEIKIAYFSALKIVDFDEFSAYP